LAQGVAKVEIRSQKTVVSVSVFEQNFLLPRAHNLASLSVKLDYRVQAALAAEVAVVFL
jgi:hypothetical protein